MVQLIRRLVEALILQNNEVKAWRDAGQCDAHNTYAIKMAEVALTDYNQAKKERL